MTIRRVAALALIVAMFLTGCGFASTDLQTEIQRPGYSFYLRVYDDTGLVTEVQPGPAPVAAPDGTATAHPDRETIDVGWLGGVCHRTPVIHVNGSSSHLVITVEADATVDIVPLPVSCPAVGILLTATLQLSEPVAQDAISMEVR